METLPPTLLDLLSNSLVLGQVSPLLPISSLLSLSSTSKSLRHLIYTSREAWRYLDLSPVRSAQLDASPIDVGGVSWRAERMDEALTEDDFYAGPLRGIFSRLHSWKVLKWVQVLVLDGLSVPADLVREIVMEERFGVRILSLRGATHLNLSKLQQVLMYAVRPTRPETELRFKALYIFGPKDDPSTQAMPSTTSSFGGGVTTSQGAQIGAQWNNRSAEALQLISPDDRLPRWYGSNGRVLKPQKSEWAGTLQACQGLVAFDAVLCRGPRHDISKVNAADYLPLAVATVALGPAGCEICKTCPEGPAVCGSSDAWELPLLSPPPTHAVTVRAAQGPDTVDRTSPRLLLRCEDCLRGRWCERCNRWWCETCYPIPMSREKAQTAQDISQPNMQIGVHRDCFDCGRTCQRCKTRYMRTCRMCRQEYCILDNEGSTDRECDWCNRSGRAGRGEMY